MTATTALETETTVDVAPGWRMPDLAGLLAPAAGPDRPLGIPLGVEPAGVRRLSATYLDTADLRLLRSRVTLRRRTGGPDAGWHLKLPLGEARLEVRHEARRPPAEVPAHLAALVRSRTRGEPLVPVAVLRTTRTVRHVVDAAGRVLVEVVDDRVVAHRAGGQTERWREVEVELVEGDRALLDAVVAALLARGARPAVSQSKLARALAADLAAPSADAFPAPTAGVPAPHLGAPAPPRTAGDVVLAYLGAQVAEVVDRDPQVRLDLPDAVHRMRVAVRRLRATLATYRRLLDEDAVAPLRAELRWWGTVLGAARDAEVLRDRLLAALADLPPDEGDGGGGRLRAALDRELTTARSALLAALDGPRYLALLDALATLVDAPPWRGRAGRAPTAVHPGVRRAVRRVRHALRSARRAAVGPPLDTALHDARKAAKAARYAAESVAGLAGAPATALVEGMTAAQDVLGAHQDSLVARARLADLAAAAVADGYPTATLDALVALERARHGDGPVALAAARELRPGRWRG